MFGVISASWGVLPWMAGLGSDAFRLMCHCLISSRTLGEALALAQAFNRLTYPQTGYRMEFERGAASACLTYQVRGSDVEALYDPDVWSGRENYDAILLSSGLRVWYTLCGWLTGREMVLDGVRIAAPCASRRIGDTLEKLFHCPVHYEAADNALFFPQSLLDYKIVQTPESLARFLDNALYHLILTDSTPSSTSAAVKSLLGQDFKNGLPSFEDMADSLHMSASSLRRRLLKENTSYQQLKDQCRREAAIAYLRREDLKIGKVGELLGFAEPSSFVRSFRSWTGMTPKAFRQGVPPLGV